MAASDFFHDTYHDDHDFFDECPTIIVSTNAVNTSSIDTSGIDAYRQGVELTLTKHFDAGTVKIHSPEAGHKTNPISLGMRYRSLNACTMHDEDRFNPSDYVSKTLTFPIIIDDRKQVEEFSIDGVIEPLTIREAASLSSIEMPYIAHAVRGSLQAGNEDSTHGVERILTVDHHANDEFVAFDDTIIDGPMMNDCTYLRPFADERYIRNVDTTYPADFTEALSRMTGSTEDYISRNERSSTAGWEYDTNIVLGTDSLAFGGMTY